jgi:hypothetical protein
MNEANATPHAELIAELMNPNNPKNEREYAAVREIERLREDQQGSDAVDTLTEESWIWDGDQWQRPPESNQFKPDWNTEAVLVEEMQRMAKRIEGLEAMLTRQTARIVDLQTHIENFEG